MVKPQPWLVFLLVSTILGSDLPPLIWEDNDRRDIPEPAERKRSTAYDFATGILARPVGQVLNVPRHVRKLTGTPVEARNVNAVDEVPNSSWYTNRNFLYPMSEEELERGPQKESGPSGPSGNGPWKVIACKTEGITPGLQIRDSNGVVFLIKFDPPAYPELMSAADVIGSKFFYAAGYNVPVNSIVTFPREKLEMPAGIKCPLKGVPLNGEVRALASRLLDGKPKGPFSYTEIREDDPNDVIPHEDRRELRGLRILASFINHHDLKELNTLDMYVNENGQKFLKHHLIDFGGTLGSATVEPKTGQEGHEYIFDAGEILKSTLTLGIYRRRAHHGETAVVHPSIGHIESGTFDPAVWKANLPIPPFQKMTDRDAYWGAKIVAALTDTQIRALVKTGRYSDPVARGKLIEILKVRRDKIANYWFRRTVAPLDRFRFAGGRLVFDDLAVNGGYDCRNCPAYRMENTDSTVRITRTSPGWPEQKVVVHFGRLNGRLHVHGVER